MGAFLPVTRVRMRAMSCWDVGRRRQGASRVASIYVSVGCVRRWANGRCVMCVGRVKQCVSVKCNASKEAAQRMCRACVN